MVAFAALLVVAMSDDANAQSGSCGAACSAARAVSPQVTYSAPPVHSTMGTYTSTQSAPIAVGSGCVSGNCGGTVVSSQPIAQPTVHYSTPVSTPVNSGYTSYAPSYQPTYGVPVSSVPTSSWQGPRYQTYSAPTCSNGTCSANRVYRNRR
ncbi:MAG: hypothetical protein ACF8AM_08840 [Rhodopirellula sp. JB055]|uniref:hypothetical protein n=1 Tax=Rhodopirellula sp. JB055 TaxID=3342846 RepID=UPI00370C10AB